MSEPLNLLSFNVLGALYPYHTQSEHLTTHRVYTLPHRNCNLLYTVHPTVCGTLPHKVYPTTKSAHPTTQNVFPTTHGKCTPYHTQKMYH
uniref:Uncharacterized protein n=1 Tax=Arion vulgaris TaxID=1028688 RepID=A0A0B6ZLY5_9EUPU